MKPIDSIYDLQWKPRVLIEASAGTGKTYTLTALYIRLLIEKKLEVEQILVMTFTKKATAELKERIFRRLKECLHRLVTGNESDDDFANELYSRIADRNTAIQQLQRAIRNFDDSQVYTIHGFCQKILKEEALLAGTPFEFEVVQQDELLKQASEDFWRIFMKRYSSTKAGRYYISKLIGIATSPSELRNKLEPMFSKSYARLEGEGMERPLEYLRNVISVRKEIVRTWNENEQILLEILRSCDVSRFQQHLDSRLKKLKAFIYDESFELDKPESLKYFTSGYLYDPANLPKTGNPKPTQRHSFFDLCFKFEKLIQDIEKIKTTLIGEAFQEIKKIREKLSINSNTVTYDDLLKKVEEVLVDSNHADELSGALLQKYPAALVDEFQDTDPIQYNILKSIYVPDHPDTTLLMIGDPKQAIYGFRGADIYTYIKARDQEQAARYTLQKNYRSAPGFNQAVNTLFGYSSQPFIQHKIGYSKVESGNAELQKEFQIGGKPASGIEIITNTGIKSKKDEARQFVFSQVIREITHLLSMAESGGAMIKERKLQASDIAVLVSSHKDAENIKQRLKRAGIDSVTYSREKVFESAEARRINDVMKAILEPYDRKTVNSALLSGFWGQNLNQIYELTVEGDQRQELIGKLQELNEVWSRDGFYPMFRKLIFSDDRFLKLARRYNSERALTNLQQLADISAKAEKEGKLDPHSLHSWFEKEMADPDKDEEKTLLLESDQNLVKISTIHNSKGLEFPVVLCPTLWDVKSGKNRKLLTEYHNGEQDAVIRYDQTSGDEAADAELKSAIEDTAEEVRKYYVAVTRARYLCIIPWSNHKDAIRSGMISSFIDRNEVTENIEKKSKLVNDSIYSDQTLLELFRKLEEKSGGRVRLSVADEAQVGGDAPVDQIHSAPELHLRRYNGRTVLEPRRTLESFSSLSGHSSEPDEPEYDQIMDSYAAALAQPESTAGEQNIFTFPRGATAGTAIHKLFEERDFQFETALERDHTIMIRRVLEQYRIDERWVHVVQEMIYHVVSADIPGLDLSRVTEGEQLREMEFHFPSVRVSLNQILEIIRENGGFTESTGDVRRLMTGFIDLTVRQDGQYFIVDYKSNYLGDSVLDYQEERMKEEIQGANYDVQYHLYTVALCLYLKHRDPNFSYEKDFGGVAYLFVRGMRKGEDYGVWYHKPDKQIIDRLAEALEVEI